MVATPARAATSARVARPLLRVVDGLLMRIVGLLVTLS